MANELEVQIIPVLENQDGFSADNVASAIFNFNFNLDTFGTTVGWRLIHTTSGGTQVSKEVYQTFEAKDLSQVEMDAFGVLSKSIHARGKSLAFLPTPDGLKSFEDLQSTVVVVGTVEDKVASMAVEEAVVDN